MVISRGLRRRRRRRRLLFLCPWVKFWSLQPMREARRRMVATVMPVIVGQFQTWPVISAMLLPRLVGHRSGPVTLFVRKRRMRAPALLLHRSPFSVLEIFFLLLIEVNVSLVKRLLPLLTLMHSSKDRSVPVLK
jgi:hypothetical protein